MDKMHDQARLEQLESYAKAAGNAPGLLFTLIDTARQENLTVEDIQQMLHCRLNELHHPLLDRGLTE